MITDWKIYNCFVLIVIHKHTRLQEEMLVVTMGFEPILLSFWNSRLLPIGLRDRRRLFDSGKLGLSVCRLHQLILLNQQKSLFLIPVNGGCDYSYNKAYNYS